MSINWVLLEGTDIVPLENETIFWRKKNVCFSLDCSNGGYPGAGNHYYAKRGELLLTNQRVVYLSETPTSFFSNASIPLNKLEESKLVERWFSSSSYKAVVMPLDGAAPQHLEQLPTYEPQAGGSALSIGQGSSSTPAPSATSDIGPSSTTTAPPLPQPVPLPTPESSGTPLDAPPSYDELH
ncbi:hypothetical protein BGW41_001812 [Actinomortierella wolfii]|nr:hypothetical protein BGW41_001812 [Actinomortierella wolfii]